MDKKLITPSYGRSSFFDSDVNVPGGGGREEREGESEDIVLVHPEGDEDRIEDSKEGKPPGDVVDYDGLRSGRGELVDDGAEKEEVDDRPNKEDRISWGEIRLLDVFGDRPWGDYEVDVEPREEGVRDDVDNLEKETFCPLRRGNSCSPGLSRRWRKEGGDYTGSSCVVIRREDQVGALGTSVSSQDVAVVIRNNRI